MIRSPRFLFWTALCATVALGAPVQDAPAPAGAALAPVAGIAPAVARPVAVRGGVIMLPLLAQQPGTGWPDRVRLRFDSGDELDATLVRVFSAPSRAVHWTSSPGALAVEPVVAGSDPLAQGASIFALVEVPEGLEGDFHLRAFDSDVPDSASGAAPSPAGLVDERFAVRPLWVDRPPSPWPQAPALPMESGPGRPDVHSPFDWWRWTLLARRQRLQPPPPQGSAIEQLVARHAADLWAVGLARLATQSEGVAAECIELLTNTCRDGAVEVATWVVDPLEVSTLLNILVDFNRQDRSVMEGAFTWARAHAPEAAWVESDAGDSVEIAIANPSVAEMSASAQWLVTSKEVGEPVTFGLAARSVTRIRLDRPREVPGDTLGRIDWRTVPMSVVVAIERRELALVVPPAVLQAQPPGLVLPPFRAVLTLAEARRAAAPAIDRSIAAMIRRVRGRWEIFAEGTTSGTAGAAGAAAPLEPAGPLQLPIGREALTVAIGPRGNPTQVLCVPLEGEAWMSTGGSPDQWPDLEIRRRVEPGAWRLRIVLPDAWLAPYLGLPLPLALVRTHAATAAFEATGAPPVPWSNLPAPTFVDLGVWDGFPATVDRAMPSGSGRSR